MTWRQAQLAAQQVRERRERTRQRMNRAWPAIVFGLIVLAILLSFLWAAVPLAVQCWDKDHAHHACPPTHRSDSPKRAG